MDDIVYWINWFGNEMKTNPILVAVLGGGVFGSIIMYFRSAYTKIKNLIVPVLWTELRINEMDDIHYQFAHWINVKINQSKYRKRIRTQYNREDDYHLGQGKHLFVYKFRPVVIDVHIETKQSMNDSKDDKVTYHVSIFGFSNLIMLDFINHIRKEYNVWIKRPREHVSVLVDQCLIPKLKRPMDTICGNKENISKVIKKIDFFLNNKQWYTDRGISYKLNLLLYGDPGCGKSSLILALASYYNKNIASIDISKAKLHDSINHNWFNVIEDIDMQFASVMTKRDSLIQKDMLNKPINIHDQVKLNATAMNAHTSNNVISANSLSNILNVLDGLNTVSGAICIITTNDISSLDSAFLRPGRMDMIIEVEPLTKEDIYEMSNIFEIEIDKQLIPDDIRLPASNVQEIFVSKWNGIIENIEEAILDAYDAYKLKV